MKWQPIETAPMDGTKILGYDPSVYPDERMVVMDFSIIGWAASVGEGDYERYSPTHWMPLPEAPNVKSEPTRAASAREVGSTDGLGITGE